MASISDPKTLSLNQFRTNNIFFNIGHLCLFTGGGSASERDGCDWPGLRGHAGAEQPAAAAATREGRRQFQADERADQIQPDLQAAQRGEGGAGGPGSHI